MERRFFITMIVTAFLMLSSYQVKAQTAPPAELPKFEVAADFSSLTLASRETYPGVGGRFTYNLNKHVALEAAGYFFPGKCDTCGGPLTGRITEGLFGVKAGKRFQKWGVFAKARPGFITFSRGAFDIVPTGAGGLFPFRFDIHRQTNFALDLGGVLEFYPSKKIVVRFDVGDTLIHYPSRTSNFLIPDPANPGGALLVPFTNPAHTSHSIQFIGGVGFRF